MNADLDAYSLAQMIEDSTDNDTLASILTDYYFSPGGADNRFSTWINNSDRDDVIDRVNIYCDDYFTVAGINVKRWPLINDSVTIDNTHQNQFSEAFADYMLDNAGRL